MNNKWFTLIEVIVATGILAISVFWVYKLIWENSKIIENSNNYLNTTLLFPVIENCIENSWINAPRYFDLGNNLKDCNASSNEVINDIDNIWYILYSEIIENTSTWRIWETSVISEFTWTNTWIYIQKK